MKRFQVYAVVVMTALFIVIAIFWHSSHEGANVVTEERLPTNAETSASLNNSAAEKITPSQTTQPPASPNDRLAQMGITPDMTKSERQEKYAEWYIKEAHKLVPAQRPFEFFGRVVDENTQAVEGASVHLILSTTSSANGIMDADTSSAADGSFSLTGKTGSSVSIYVSKSGYYEIKSLNQINFDPTGNGSTPDNPVLFHLRKKGVGTDLITSKYGFTPWFDVSVPINGQPIKADLLNRSAGANGQIEFSNIKPEYLQAKQATSWSFKMEIPDGGFVEENDEFPFEAPESGYQSIVQFDFQKGQPGWTWDLQKNYYIKFGNPPKYGTLHLETSIGSGVRLTYAINPDGSRYLEPKN
jgi:hypothetical protein